ncbi:sensor histidine kinase [Poriferisphaera sp. WC338]|uniref:sensor histidine kinase n=1 Tax=Poriferisphaera sp. WC338 TaxID=3425129 RepID=UPI003D814673
MSMRVLEDERQTAEGSTSQQGPIPCTRSLYRRILLWTLILIIMPTLTCAIWLNWIARSEMEHNVVLGADRLTQTAAVSLEGELTYGWSDHGDRIVMGLLTDPRVAAVIVEKPDGRLIRNRTTNPHVWAALSYQPIIKSISQSIEETRPLSMPDGGMLVVRKHPIWSTNSGRTTRKLEGYITLAVNEHHLPEVMDHMQLAQLTAAAMVCLLMMPLVMLATNWWIRPLRQLMQATAQLARGEKPEKIQTTTRDELAVLGAAFNGMSDRLFETRQQLENANEDLENKVIQRTAELERLNDRLQDEIDDKNEFLRAVTHDLNAPVRNITGMAQMLLMKHKTDLADDALNKIERITANAKLQSELISDLLELSQIRTKPGKNVQVDISKLVDEIAQSLSFDLEQADITLKVQPQLPVINADRNRIRQVFQNLLDNAVKYMLDSEERSIAVTCDHEDDQYHFRIADTGCGISDKDLKKVFQVFSRAAYSNSHHVAGKGVGLASVKSILENHHGRIWVESVLGKGSTFHFTLPCDIADNNRLSLHHGLKLTQ